MQSWDEMSRKEQLVLLHYDFYKDVHGCRPRWVNYDKLTEQELEAMLDCLAAENVEVEKQEEEREKQCIAAFEDSVQKAINAGAEDRAEAIRWLFQACEDHYVANDPDYFCYLHGLPYGYFKEPV